MFALEYGIEERAHEPCKWIVAPTWILDKTEVRLKFDKGIMQLASLLQSSSASPCYLLEEFLCSTGQQHQQSATSTCHQKCCIGRLSTASFDATCVSTHQ